MSLASLGEHPGQSLELPTNCMLWGAVQLHSDLTHTHVLTGSLRFAGRFGPSLVRGLLAVSLAANALFTSAFLYQSLR